MSSLNLRMVFCFFVSGLAATGCGESQSTGGNDANENNTGSTIETGDNAAPNVARQDAEPRDVADLSVMPAGRYTVDTSHTSVFWKVSHLGLSNYTARFLTIDGHLQFDPSDVTASQVEITIDADSIHTGFPRPEEEDFDTVLGEEEIWFNAGEHPTIRFTSTSIEFSDPSTASVTGDLTMLGTTHPVTLQATVNGAMPKKPRTGEAAIGISATTTISRSEWGLDTFVGPVGDEVTVIIEAEFERPGESEPSAD